MRTQTRGAGGAVPRPDLAELPAAGVGSTTESPKDSAEHCDCNACPQGRSQSL